MTKLNTFFLGASLVLLGLATHGIGVGQPREVVFDEVHFGKFVTAYCCTGERFFDIHPPHAKLLIAGVAHGLGYTGDFSFENIGQAFGDVPVLALRALPLLMGIIFPVVFFVFLRQLGASFPIAWLGGGLAALDNAWVVQTRFILLDGLLLTATFGSLVAFLAADHQLSRGRWMIYMILAGALAGLAAGVKFTGLAALALLGAVTLTRLVRRSAERQKWFQGGVILLTAAAVVYLAGWAIHFMILTEPGPGDAWGMPTGNFFNDLVHVHQQMLSANYNLEATHPDQSPWWSWPIMKASVFYWFGGENAGIYFLGNPVVWWGSTVLFLLAIGESLKGFWQSRVEKHTRKPFGMAWIPLLGFIVAMVPLVRVPRALFLYHYLTPLFFALAFGLLSLDRVLEKRGDEVRRKVVLGIFVLVLVVFLIFSPLTYGFPVSGAWYNSLFWFPAWR